MTAEQVLDRLDGAKATGDGKWIALCPAHDDRSPSLSVAVGDDERVLLTCHAGCAAEEIVSAVGLTMGDLFAERGNGDRKPEIVATYDYVDGGGELLFQVVRFSPKDFRQRRPDGGGGYIWKLGDTRRVPYRLPKVIEAAKAGGKVAIVEGEKDVHTLEARGLVATCNPGGAGKWREEYAESLRGAQVAVVADADAPGRKHAREVAASLEGVAGSVRLLEPAEGCKDVSEHLDAGHPLSALVPVEEGEPESKDQGPPPDTAELLDAIASTLRRFVVLTDAQRDVLASWTLHAHAIDAADSTPYIHVSSPEKQSGKSRTLEVEARLVPRPMEAANCSDPALFRALSAEDGPATLLYDEVDTLFGRGASTTKEEQRGLLNAGWRRGAVAWRCEGDGSKQTATPYPVFGAKMLAGIGELPDTLADRCIPLRLRRRRPDELVERGRYRVIGAACEPLRRDAARWAAHYVEHLQGAEPDLPDELSDRAQDGAEPLLAIGELAGGGWPRRLRTALVELHGDKSEESESWGVRLLADVQAAFCDDDQLPTAELLTRLKADPEAPWGAWGKGDTGLTPRGIAALLKPYKVRSSDIHVGEGEDRKTLKGYVRSDFEDPWGRYLAPDSALSRANRANGSTEPKTGGSVPRQEEEPARIESGRKPHGNADGADGAGEMHNGGTRAATEAEEAEIERVAAKLGGTS